MASQEGPDSFEGHRNHVDRAIGERVAQGRSARGIPINEVARALDVTTERLKDLENGNARFSASQLRTLSDLMEVKPSFFFETVSATGQRDIERTESPNWLAAVLGKKGAPEAPGLRTDRIKELLRRAVLLPGSLAPSEVQELAASVLLHLVGERK